MADVTLDVVLLLPPETRHRAVEVGRVLTERMGERDNPSRFRLAEPFPGTAAGPCEPHVSLFMLCVGEAEVADVVRAARTVAAGCPALDARGDEYRHNPQGAPELYFQKSSAWEDLQLAVIDRVEPLRAGRLRDRDPSGADIAELLRTLPPDNVRRRQLERYGYDEVADAERDGADRFNPHVTLAWPHDPEPRVGLRDLPAPSEFDATLGELAVFAMSPYGTCTTEYDRVRLGGGS